MLSMLMGFIADLVFRSAASGSRAYEAEIDRYLVARGYFRPSRTKLSH